MMPPGSALIVLVAGLLLAGHAAAAAEFGRLFFSVAERDRLDHPPPTEVVQTPPPPALRVDGIVRSSRGESTVWVNGSPAPIGQARPAGTGDAARVTGPEGDDVVLRVGETYLPETGERKSTLPRVDIHRPASAR